MIECDYWNHRIRQKSILAFTFPPNISSYNPNWILNHFLNVEIVSASFRLVNSSMVPIRCDGSCSPSSFLVHSCLQHGYITAVTDQSWPILQLSSCSRHPTLPNTSLATLSCVMNRVGSQRGREGWKEGQKERKTGGCTRFLAQHCTAQLDILKSEVDMCL